MRLTKSQIVNSQDLKTKMIDMPEWGGEVEIKVMSVGQQLELEKIENKDDTLFHLVQKCCIDEKGELLFDDVEQIKSKSTESVMRLYREILDLNKQKSTDVETEAKNS